MRVLGAGLTVLLVAWVLYLAAPYVTLLRLADAIAARDVPAIVTRLNINAVRTSLVKQLVAGSDIERSEPPGIGLGAGTVALALAPAVATIVTPEVAAETVVGSLTAAERPDARTPVLVRLIGIARNSRWRGFRNVYLTVPPDAAPGRAVRLQLRLSRLSWRLVAVDLPADARKRLGRAIAAVARTGQPLPAP